MFKGCRGQGLHLGAPQATSLVEGRVAGGGQAERPPPTWLPGIDPPSEGVALRSLAAQNLKRRLRKIPGVPIMYLKNHKYQIERLPEAYLQDYNYASKSGGKK